MRVAEDGQLLSRPQEGQRPQNVSVKDVNQMVMFLAFRSSSNL